MARGGGKRQQAGGDRPRRGAQRNQRGQGDHGRRQNHPVPRRQEERHQHGDHPQMESGHQVCGGQPGCHGGTPVEPPRPPQAEVRSCACKAPPTHAVVGEGGTSWYPMQGYLRTSYDPK